MSDTDERLFLFDIDGTLLHTHGLARVAMENTLKKYSYSVKIDNRFSFAGKTDWEIVETLLHAAGYHREVTKFQIKSILKDFTAELDKELAPAQKPFVYDGVQILLDNIRNHNSSYLGLLTGNNQRGAEIKLNAAGMNHYFPVGGFGDDAKNRNDLPPFAIKRAEKYYHKNFDKNYIWIIGDSIYDIRCAQHNDLRCLAVSTGWMSKEQLVQENPEYLVDDFEHTDQILEILFSQ